MNIFIKNIYIPQFLFAAFAFLVGFGGQKLPQASALLVLGWLMDVSLNRKSLLKSKENFIWLYLPMLLIFVLSAVSLGYSDFQYGLKVIERRLLFLIVPIIGLVGVSNKINFSLVLKYFVYGVVFAMLYVVIKLAVDVLLNDYLELMLRQDFLKMFMKYIGMVQHRTYFGINIILSMLIISEHYKGSKWHVLALFVIMMLFVLLSGARATSVTVLIFLFAFSVRYALTKSNKILLGIAVVVGGVALVFFLFLYPRVLESILEGGRDDESRIKLWMNTISALKGHWIFGYGIGDFIPELLQLFKEKGARHASMYGLNPHNQYLHYIGEIGVVGLVAILWGFVGLIKVAPSRNKFIALMIIMIFGVNFCFESVLLRLWGVSSFVLLYLYFGYAKSRNILHEKTRIETQPILIISCVTTMIFVLLFLTSYKGVVFNPNDPLTYAQSPFSYVEEFPGELLESFPKYAAGYKLDASAEPFYGLSNISDTEIGIVKANSCDSVEMWVYCYVSPDFSGDYVYAGGYAKNYAAKSFYDLSMKGTWQRLYVKTECANLDVGYHLQFAESKDKEIKDLIGYVIFVQPTLLTH